MSDHERARRPKPPSRPAPQTASAGRGGKLIPSPRKVQAVPPRASGPSASALPMSPQTGSLLNRAGLEAALADVSERHLENAVVNFGEAVLDIYKKRKRAD